MVTKETDNLKCNYLLLNTESYNVNNQFAVALNQ